MAGRVRVVQVHVEVVDQTMGLWCNRCMLSTGVSVTVAISLGDRMHLQERLWCVEHEGSRGVVRDPS
ncbi:hypothetical protein [Nocardioides sp. T2.26MG-1]|uniref:hypothetical protein n=1 Tax=Nocardioides sp. T2.26MG-1 TaxID=3041166 RepID=UPI002477694E|nr:hypothetical protein [Nocardioides sp. T2.26MG-1]CAI9417324.1 hypothetical protein HIDPHFAB_02991 [Nocardioides sp. T2.26MG-1]